MDHARTERAGFLFQFSGLVKRTVESPVETNMPFPGVPQHAHEPVFYRSTIEVFDYVEYSFGQRLCWESAASVRLARYYRFKHNHEPLAGDFIFYLRRPQQGAGGRLSEHHSRKGAANAELRPWGNSAVLPSASPRSQRWRVLQVLREVDQQIASLAQN
jgi:hypothetical protein